MKKVSIIIPVYNSQEYLPKCLESVECQTLKDIEIICVNDGSTDNSLDILKSYALKDDRFVVINKENGGVSSARNAGLDAAEGEFVMFLDADDLLELQACEIAYNAVISQGCDIGVFSYWNLFENSELKLSYRGELIQKMLNNEIETNYFLFQAAIWDKIYKLSLLNDNNIRFVEHLKTSEDSVFCFMTSFCNPKYCLIDKSLYIHRLDNSNSVTNTLKSCIKTDLDALEYFYNTSVFQRQTFDVQLKVIERFCLGCVYFYKKFCYEGCRAQFVKDIKNTLKYIEARYDKKSLNSLAGYNKVKSVIKFKPLKFLFSINNTWDKKYKVLTIVGMDIKFKNSRKAAKA